MPDRTRLGRPPVSVVVPFHGGPADARATLGALAVLRLSPADDVIVVDNTVERVLARQPVTDGVRVVEAPLERSSYYARNVGAEQAGNHWLLFMDSDCRPAADLLDAYFTRPIDDRVGVVSGAVVAASGQTSLVARYAASRRHIDPQHHIEGKERPSGITANLLVRRSAWEQVGGFQEGVRSGADVEFCWRVQDAGWGFAYRREAVVEHEHVDTLRRLLRKAARHAGGGGWVNRRYPGGGFPRTALEREIPRAAVGVAAWMVAGQFRRAVFKAIDGLWLSVDGAARVLASNGTDRVRAVPRTGGQGVLVVDRSFPALSATFVVNEVRAMRALGRPVRVEAFMRPQRPERQAARELTVTYLEDAGLARRITDLGWLVGRHPVRCARDLVDRRRWSREEAWPLRALAPAARRMATGEERHVHAHFATDAALVALRLSRLLDVPYSVTAHAHEIYRSPRNLEEKLREAAFVTSGCDYTVRHLRQVVGPRHADRVHRIVMGVDAERFRRTRPHPAGRTVLAVGRLVEKKGFAHLIDAAGLLRDRDAAVRVLVVGDGPLRPSLEDRIVARGLERSVELLGWRDPDAVRELLEEVDVLAMPCVVARDGDRDSMPVVVKEALAMEVPVVATDEVGLPEIVREEWGRIVPARDAGALADAVGDLLSLPVAERAEMGRRGRAFVVEHAEVHRQTARLLELIADVRRR